MDFTNIEVVKTLINTGVGGFIAILMIVLIYRLFNTYGAAFIKAQQDMAKSMAQQAQSMEFMRTGVMKYVERDNAEHREMMVLLKYIAQAQEAFAQVRLEHEGIHGNQCRTSQEGQ